MREQQTMNIAMSILVDIYLGVFESFPTFFDMVKEYKLSSYYEEIVLRDIDFNNNMSYITADNRAVSEVRKKLQEKGTPYFELESKVFDGVIKTNGNSIFILREADYERAVELTKEILHEHEKALEKEQEQEEELELIREEEIRGAREYYENDTPDQPKDAVSGDSLIQEDIEEAPEKDSKNKKRSKSHKKKTSVPAGTNVREQNRREDERKNREQRDRERERSREREREAERVGRQAEQREYEHKNRDRKMERKAPEYREGEQNDAQRNMHAEKAASGDGNQFKSADFHSQTVIKDGSGYEARRETERENRIAEPGAVASMEKHDTKSQTAETARASQAEQREYERKNRDQEMERKAYEYRERKRNDAERGTYAEKAASGNGNQFKSADFHNQTVIKDGSGYETRRETERENRITEPGAAASHTSEQPRTSEPYRTENRTGQETHARDSNFSSSVIGNGADISRKESNAANTARMQSIPAGTHFSDSPTGQGKPPTSQSETREYQNAGSEHSNASAKELRHVAGQSGDKVKVSVGKIKEGAIAKSMFDEGIIPGNVPILSQSTNFVLNRQFPENAEVIFNERGEKYHCVVRMNITGEVMKNRALSKLASISTPEKIRSLTHSSKRLIVSSTINRDSDAGMAAQEMIDIGSPTGRLMLQNILHNGGIQFSRDVKFNIDTFTAAYAAAYGLSLEKARKQIIAFSLTGAFTGYTQYNVDKTIALWEQAVAGQEHNIAFLREKGPHQFHDIISQLSDSGFRTFIQNAAISDELKKAMLGYSREQLSNPEIIAGLLKKHNLPRDAEFLKAIHAADMSNRFRKGSFSGIIQRYILQIRKRMAKDIDAGRAWMDIYYSARYMYSAYSSMIKLTMKVLGKFGITDPARMSGMIADPLSTMGKAAQKKTVGLISKTQPGKAVSRFGKSANAAIRKRVRSKIRRTGVVQIARTIKNTKAVAQITNFTNKLSKIAAQIAVKVGVLLGKLAVVVIVIVILLEIIQSQIKDSDKDTGMSSYTFVQDTEILQEVITELTAKNEQFIVDINNAANHRGNYAASSGVTANENVSFYESYSIIFRDSEGNILEPSHVDLNNTKAIISMATRFMPYPFIKLQENASEERKKEYEDLKQHFKDYCYFLWAATHQISIEEYHPGDANYSEYDTSGLETTLDKGKCDQNGTTIWLPEDFTPNKITQSSTEYACPTCSALPAYSRDNGYALCTHGKDANPLDGWRMTGSQRDAVNCHEYHCHHYCDHSEEDYDCDPITCSLDNLDHVKRSHRSHYHLEYEWVYECGGHMGNVVYVTIGDLSRVPGFPVAGDIDYGAVAVYPGEDGTEITEAEDDN